MRVAEGETGTRITEGWGLGRRVGTDIATRAGAQAGASRVQSPSVNPVRVSTGDSCYIVKMVMGVDVAAWIAYDSTIPQSQRDTDRAVTRIGGSHGTTEGEIE